MNWIYWEIFESWPDWRILELVRSILWAISENQSTDSYLITESKCLDGGMNTYVLNKPGDLPIIYKIFSSLRSILSPLCSRVRLLVQGWPRSCQDLDRDQVNILHLSRAGNGSLVVEGVQAYSTQLEAWLYSQLGWGPWTSWRSCSSWCGGGSQQRVRTCLARPCASHTKESRLCNTFSCSGQILKYFPNNWNSE